VSTKAIQASDIRGLRSGRYRLLGPVRILDLGDGSARSTSAIQLPDRALSRPAAKARLVVAELND
jgi:hypothetical protein